MLNLATAIAFRVICLLCHLSDIHLVCGTRVGSLKLAAVALLQAQRQSDSIRLENLSKRALADWKVRLPACATAFCIDTVFV